MLRWSSDLAEALAGFRERRGGESRPRCLRFRRAPLRYFRLGGRLEGAGREWWRCWGGHGLGGRLHRGRSRACWPKWSRRGLRRGWSRPGSRRNQRTDRGSKFLCFDDTEFNVGFFAVATQRIGVSCKSKKE